MEITALLHGVKYYTTNKNHGENYDEHLKMLKAHYEVKEKALKGLKVFLSRTSHPAIYARRKYGAHMQDDATGQESNKGLGSLACRVS